MTSSFSGQFNIIFVFSVSSVSRDACFPAAAGDFGTSARERIQDAQVVSLYGDESAVNVTVEVLRRMNINDAADRLKRAYLGAVESTI